MEKKGTKIWKRIAAVVVVAGVLGCAAVSTFTLVTLKGYIAAQEEEENTETTEDYVTIAEQYEILPTTDISDAYLSGDTSALDDKQKETLDMAEAAIEEMGITDDMTDYEKEKAVYDWMTTSLQQDAGALTVIPSTQEDCDNPYGVLKYHNAVCVGYATTFRMFMQMMEIECMVEHNTELWHSWDIVKLDDDWYITDIYSDAGSNSYAHFNMTDAMWSQQQTWDQDYFPKADSLKYNVAYQEKAEVDEIYDIVTALREAMDQKRGSVMISFAQEITEDDAEIANTITNMVDEALMYGNYQDMPYYLSSWNWILDPEDDSYLFCVYMGDYNSSDSADSTLSEEEMTKLQEMVNEAFEDLSAAGMGDVYDVTDGATSSFEVYEDGTVVEWEIDDEITGDEETPAEAE